MQREAQNRNSWHRGRVNGAAGLITTDAEGSKVFRTVRPKSAPPPREWHARTPHETKAGHVVYWLWLPIIPLAVGVIAAILCF